ncbi:hypothetical protein ILUMI_03786 [Ignelater luminosus]|uniref:Cytochrome P450 n=1 Tax=Ignelater luminosus TaxID=2038154 RepID=A0A8K0DDU3_IGNLU|nr:hypothetical protein ILUMI_03786 [Ignelater luminosus]
MKNLKNLNRVIRQNRLKSTTVNVNEILNLQKGSECDWKDAIPYKDVPGPKPLPFLGNTWRFVPFIGDFQIEHVDKVSKRLYEKYGNIVKMEGLLGRPDMLFLFNPDEIEKVFRQEDVMPLRPSMPSLNYYKHVYKKDFFGDNAGVIAVHGENWQNFRSKVNQIMLQPRVAKMYIKPIENTADAFVERLILLAIARIALDVRLGCLDDNAHPDTQRLIDAVTTFFINVPILELKFPFWRLFNTPTFKEYIGALDIITDTTMKHVDQALKNLQKGNGNEESSILQRILKMENDTKTACILALDMFLVGIDTTSNAVASILYQLALNPEKQRVLDEEIKRILPHKSTRLDSEKLEMMTYLKACIKETMRMYPVVIGNGRCTSRDCVIGGYQIPKGVQVIFQHYVISNLENYFPKSNQFLPERWLKTCPHSEYSDICRNHHPFASLPFGYGKRMCLGRRFADLEIQTIIAKIIQCYRVEYHYEKLDYFVHPMYTPNGPLKLRFINKS